MPKEELKEKEEVVVDEDSLDEESEEELEKDADGFEKTAFIGEYMDLLSGVLKDVL